jgi:hypothetical protein
LAISGQSIEASCGSRPHGLALALALALQQLASVISVQIFHRTLGFAVTEAVAVTAYGLAVAGWIGLTMQRRCSVRAWRIRLNSMHQILGEEYGDRDLGAVLVALRRRLVVPEIFAQCLLLAIPIWLFWDFRLAGTNLPVGLLLVFGAVVLAEQGARALSLLYAFLLLRAPVLQAPIDLPPAEDPDDQRASRGYRVFRILRRRLTRVFTAAIAFITFSAALLDATHVWHVVGQWIIHFFGR